MAPWLMVDKTTLVTFFPVMRVMNSGVTLSVKRFRSPVALTKAKKSLMERSHRARSSSSAPYRTEYHDTMPPSHVTKTDLNKSSQSGLPATARPSQQHSYNTCLLLVCLCVGAGGQRRKLLRSHAMHIVSTFGLYAKSSMPGTRLKTQKMNRGSDGPDGPDGTERENSKSIVFN